MHLRDFQTRQPWTVPYSEDFTWTADNSSMRMGHLYGSHTVLHAMKSLGKIATLFERADHSAMGITAFDKETLAAMSADLVAAALRFANLYNFDLENTLVERIREKNPPVAVSADA